jgi:hypothetical protein
MNGYGQAEAEAEQHSFPAHGTLLSPFDCLPGEHSRAPGGPLAAPGEIGVCLVNRLAKGMRIRRKRTTGAIVLKNRIDSVIDAKYPVFNGWTFPDGLLRTSAFWYKWRLLATFFRWLGFRH